MRIVNSEIRILIIAADPLVRSALFSLLDELEACRVVGVASPVDLNAAIVEESLAAPDVILWDQGWESGDLTAIDFRIFEEPVIALVSGDEQAVDAWHAGAAALLARDVQEQALAQTMQAVLRGLVVLDPSVSSLLLPAPARRQADLQDPPTTRELEVLQMLAQGLTNRAIAQELAISEHTVKFHVNAILSKFEAQSRTEAVVTAMRLGFISL